MFFIFSPSVRSPTTMLSYQTSLKVEKFLSGRWNKNSFKEFRWRRYSLKETTGQFGLGFSYIKPPSKPSSSSRRLFCKFIRCFAQVHCSVLRCSCPSIHISIYELMESLSSSGAKLQHYFKKKKFVLKLFWIIQTKGSAFVQFFKVFFTYRWLVFNFCQPLSLQVQTLAPNTLSASLNSESLMMSKPQIALKCRFI